jgi:hypothetical protein
MIAATIIAATITAVVEKWVVLVVAFPQSSSSVTAAVVKVRIRIRYR